MFWSEQMFGKQEMLNDPFSSEEKVLTWKINVLHQIDFLK